MPGIRDGAREYGDMVVIGAKVRARVSVAVRDAPLALGGLLTGVQGVMLSILVVLAPALAATASAPTSDGSAAIDWGSTMVASVRLWLLAHGVPLVVNGVSFSLAPLGLLLVTVAILAALARKFCAPSWSAWAAATASYAGLVFVAAVLGAPGPSVIGQAAGATFVAVLISGPAVAYGIWRAHGATFGWLERVPEALRSGLRLGMATLAALLAMAAIVAAGFAVVARDEIAASVGRIGIDPIGGVALAFGEAMWAPNLVVWTAAWMSGRGFHVGEGSLYSPSHVSPGAVPDFPILAGLPGSDVGFLVWAPALVVALAFAVRIALRGVIPLTWNGLRPLAVATLTFGATFAVLGAASSGAMGPGRLAAAGVEVFPSALIASSLVALGFALATATVMVAGRTHAFGAVPMRDKVRLRS